MSKILFFTWPGGGNQPPAIGLAQQLQRQGHDVVVAGYADQLDHFGARGLTLTTLPRSGAAWARFDPADLMPLLINRVWACPDHIADAAELIERYAPDLVVVDCLMAAVLCAVEPLAVPCWVLVHSAPGALSPPGGPLDSLIVGALNAIRVSSGLTPVASLIEAWQQHRVISASIPELDPLGSASVPGATWIGPVFEDPPPTDWTPGGDANQPLVLVSFSSGPAWDQTSRIQRTIDGLADDPVRLVVTTGAVDPTRLACPPTATVVSYLPHAAVLPHAAAVVTHAGHGTLTAALAHGLPVVAIPNLAADQPALADQLARLGAGVALADETATPTAIARAVRDVLDAPTYGARAGQLRERIASHEDKRRSLLSLSGRGVY